MELTGTITKKKTLSGSLAPGRGSSGPIVVTRGTGTNSLIEVNTIYPNIASAENSVALGSGNEASGKGAVAIGAENLASSVNAIAIGCQMEGKRKNQATNLGAVALGTSNEASGYYAVALGNQNAASGHSAVAAGIENEASGGGAVAVGYQSAAKKTAAVAAGFQTESNGQGAAALGYGAKANGARSFVAGAFNEVDENPVDTTHGSGTRKYLAIIGNGTDDNNRSNAATLDWDGNFEVAGKMTVGTAPTADMDVATKKYVDDHAGGGPSPASTAPAMDGTAAVGTSTAYARADHVHPSDTAKITAPANPAAGAFLVWNGSAWAAQTLAAWQGGDY